MYHIRDYFDPSISEKPYLVPGEELEDYLRLLDMILESYMEYKGMGSQTKLFSRGLVVTESEMTGYFEMPPYFRERDIWDPVLSAYVDAAFDFISGRVFQTPQEEISAGGLLPIEYLKKTFSLDRKELIAILMALAGEVDRRYERIFGFLQDDISKGAPTFGLFHALSGRITPREGSEEMLPRPFEDRMFTYFLIRNEDQDGLTAPLVLQPLVKKILLGIPDNTGNNAGPFRLFTEDEETPLFFEESFRDLEAADVQQFTESRRMVFLANDDEETALHLLSRFCVGNREKLYVLDLRDLQNMHAAKRQLSLSELYLRLKISGGRLALRYDPENETDLRTDRDSELRNFLDGICEVCEPKTVYLFGKKEEPGELAALFIPFLGIPEAPVALRTKIWEYFLNAADDIRIASDVNIPDLADCYEIPYGKVRKVIGHAIATARLKPEPVIDRDLILNSLRQMNQVDFSGLATYVNPAYTWEDITITDLQKNIMKTACDRYRLRNRIGEGWGLKRKNAYGNGVSILLYGPPGTGKTMAAQVIANELALPLYRVDISQISSKYIGETEKNLGVIFDAAAKANVILFFDEADALFSKRTSVGDSHDKYANSETAYLLQKIEEYDGMSILSTNYYNNFDDAFVRRITYSVHLQQPDKETRYILWTTILPKTAKVEKNIDFKYLADTFDLSGSNIKAILFNAAYMAGAEDKPVGMKHIVRAMEFEYNKLGKLVNTSDFGDYDIYLQTVEPKKKTSEKVTEKPRKTTGVKKSR
ncbi:MAG: ATP-binding protein [Flexilinea sp.]|nr:ATP-binding protein [Flexilinea sp.]